jgi:ABC-2 type transport system permease protein
MMHRLVERGIPVEETDEISKRVSLQTFKVSEKEIREGGFRSDFVTAFVFALLLYMTILLYGVSVQRSVLEDKSSRIVEVILSAARPFHLMLGKIIGVGGVGLTQYAIWTVVAVLGTVYFKGMSPDLANVSLAPLMLVFFVIYFVLGYLLFAAIYAAIGAMVNSEQEAQQAQWPVTSLLIIPIILMQLVVKESDSTASIVLSLIPFFTPILMLMRITLSPPPAWQLALSVILLIGSILVMAAVAARIFRVGILMYGKRPSLPEILRWVRQA